VNTMTFAVAVAIVAVLAVLGAWVWTRRTRTRRLQERFGPEYARTVREAGGPGRAEEALEARAKKVASFRIRPLSAEEQHRFSADWARVQALFVDEPTKAVRDADRLITDAMHARGYPITDFDARLEHLSVDHARTVEHYRVAHAIVERRDRGEADTEALRQAMTHFRTLFEDIVGVREQTQVRRPA
jgi:hypothetical protein